MSLHHSNFCNQCTLLCVCVCVCVHVCDVCVCVHVCDACVCVCVCVCDVFSAGEYAYGLQNASKKRLELIKMYESVDSIRYRFLACLVLLALHVRV